MPDIINVLILCAGLMIMFFIGRRTVIKSHNNAEYWRGRGEGWQACEGMVMERALEYGVKDKDGLKMTRDEIWEVLVQ